MATIIGYDKSVYKRFTCHNCGAIVEYAPNEVIKTERTDEGCRIVGLHCPNCSQFHRTNP